MSPTLLPSSVSRLSRVCGRALLPSRFVLVGTALLCGLLLLPSIGAAAAPDARFQPVRDLLDQGEPARALEQLRKIDGGRATAPESLVLRGMARIMLGEIEPGARDLEAALGQDPTLREAWMNLAGLDIVEGKYDDALDRLQRAHALDPEAPDGLLNLGAVLMLMGRKAEAKTYFDRYLEIQGGSAEAHYLVAVNYAIGRVDHLAVETLGEAIGLDERLRLRARRDDRFLALDSLEYRVLLNTDSYQPPPTHHQVAAAFGARYESRENRLLYAVLQALREIDVAYDPEVESNARWALVWGNELRVKIYNQENGTGVVSLSAPPSRFSEDEWQRASQSIFRAIHAQLGS